MTDRNKDVQAYIRAQKRDIEGRSTKRIVCDIKEDL